MKDADEHFMRKAIEQALIAQSMGEVPIGAVIVRDGEVIGCGYNRRETDGNPLGHAEIMAIQQASEALGGWRLIGCQLYVTLEPCPMCAGAIVQSRIDRLVYGASDPKSGYAGSLYNVLGDDRLNHMPEMTAGVCEAECQQLLKHFFRQLRQKRNE